MYLNGLEVWPAQLSFAPFFPGTTTHPSDMRPAHGRNGPKRHGTNLEPSKKGENLSFSGSALNVMRNFGSRRDYRPRNPLENARNKIIDRRRALRSRTLDFSDPPPLCGSHEPSDGLVHYSTLARKGNPRPPQFRTI